LFEIDNKNTSKQKAFDINQVFLLNRADRYTALEGLRGLAVLMIFLVHFFAYYNNQAFLQQESSILSIVVRFLNSGQIGVDLFFVLSGFFISISLNKQKPGFLEFIVKRFLRLLPAHLFIILCLVVMHKILDFTTIFANIMFINIFFYNIKTINIVTWSLGYEVVFYTIYGLWNIKLKNIKQLHNMLAFIIVFIGLWTAQWWGQPLVSLITANIIKIPDMSRFIGFLFGIGLAKLYLNDKLKDKYGKFINSSIFPAVASLIALQWYWEWGRLHKPVYFLIVDFAFSLVIAGVLIKNKYLNYLLEQKFLRFSGIISYSFYLAHPVVVSLTFHITRGSDKYISLITHFILATCITYATSVIMFLILEKPYFTKRKALQKIE
jgi:peptidoglycan/LPS O-acetylase OafA/YrhL